MTDLRILLSRQISLLCMHEHAHAHAADRLSELYDDDKACKCVMGSTAPATFVVYTQLTCVVSVFACCAVLSTKVISQVA